MLPLFAEVMEQRGDGDAFGGVADAVYFFDTGAVQNVHQTVVNVEAMLQKSALVRAVVARAGGRGEEVTLDEKIQQLICSLARDLFLKYLQLLNNFYRLLVHLLLLEQ